MGGKTKTKKQSFSGAFHNRTRAKGTISNADSNTPQTCRMPAEKPVWKLLSCPPSIFVSHAQSESFRFHFAVEGLVEQAVSIHWGWAHSTVNECVLPLREAHLGHSDYTDCNIIQRWRRKGRFISSPFPFGKWLCNGASTHAVRSIVTSSRPLFNTGWIHCDPLPAIIGRQFLLPGEGLLTEKLLVSCWLFVADSGLVVGWQRQPPVIQRDKRHASFRGSQTYDSDIVEQAPLRYLSMVWGTG